MQKPFQKYRKNKFFRLTRRLVGNVWPRNCHICETALNDDEEILCLKCLALISTIRQDEQMPYIGAPGNIVKVRSWFVYSREEPSSQLIHAIKYHDRRRLARKLGREFAVHRLRDNLPVDMLLPIPLHWTKHFTRSYNQVREISRGISDVTGIPVTRNLYARRSHATQTRSNRQERMDNVADVFAVRKPEELDGRHIAIVDDVLTTGATLLSALKSIMAVATPASVTFLTLGRTRNA